MRLNENEITIYMVTKNLGTIDIVVVMCGFTWIQSVRDRKFRDLAGSYPGSAAQIQMKMKLRYQAQMSE